MQEKIVIFDLDDTLLNNDSDVSEYTLSVLKKAQEQGHILAFNTARSQMRSERFFSLVKPDYAIYNGGAQIVDKDGVTIFEHSIKSEICNAMVPDLFLHCEKFSMQADWFYSANEDYKAPDVKYFDFKNEEFPFDAYKIVGFSNTPEDLVPLADKFDLDFISYFGGPFCRFTARGVTKAFGNIKLLELLGRNMADVIAFGDDIGDMEMLYEAGVGVLMKNANDQLKINPVTVSEFTNHEDGVAEFLEKHLSL